MYYMIHGTTHSVCLPVANRGDLEMKLDEKIKEKIAKGIYTKAEMDYIKNLPLKLLSLTSEIKDHKSLESIRALCKSADIKAENFVIRSHRKFVGPVIVAFKKIIAPLVRYFIKDIAEQQRKFNTEVIYALAAHFGNKNFTNAGNLEKQLEVVVHK